MDIVRLPATSLAVAALVIGVAAGCSKSDDSSSQPSTSATSTTTSAEATTSKTTSAEASPTAAQPSDYGSLLLPPTDIGPDIVTPGGVQMNPGGNPGAAQVYSSPEGHRQIIDTILVFPDVAAAESNFQSNSATMNTVVTGAPAPVEVGDQGVMAIGTSPDGSKAVTVLLFTQGKALVSMNFESAPNDPVPPEQAQDIALQQATLIADGLPEE